MKKNLCILVLLIGFVFISFAQTDSSYFKAQTTHYSVMSEESQARADSIAQSMDAYFNVFNTYFHFDVNLLKSRLNIRSFASKESFDAYLETILGQTRDDFVYLHYATQEKCELLVFQKDEEEFAISLVHQGFVQFLKAFVSNPPLWLREGFAVFFEQLRFDAKSGIAVYRENLSWLETVKSYKQDDLLFTVEDLFVMNQDDVQESLDVYYPQSWIFVSFLVNTELKVYNRFLWDVIATLTKEATFEDNAKKVETLASNWIGFNNLNTQFLSYVDTRKTFIELINDGMALYSEKEYDKAKIVFLEANKLNDTNHIPYYYLGLIAYYQKDYIQAESFYRTSLQMGCEAGIANYALGINAYSNNRFEDAKAFLMASKESSPDKYGTKADELLAKIK